MSINLVGNERSDGSQRGIYEIPGEPAIVIDGLPKVSEAKTDSVACKTGEESEVDKGFGEWVEGREVRKLFGERYYWGMVIEYDREAGWYRVVYEDGDSEDLDWHELEEVIRPLDIMVPLKMLALKRTKKTQSRLPKTVAARGKSA